MTISPAKMSDMRAFREMFSRFQQHHFKAKSEFFIDPSRINFTADAYRQMIEDPSRLVLLAREGKQTTGMLVVSIVPVRVGELQYPRTRPIIEMLTVHENWRRHGIARTLVETAEAWAREKGYREIVTDVWSFSEKAIELFRSEGYDFRSSRLYKAI